MCVLKTRTAPSLGSELADEHGTALCSVKSHKGYLTSQYAGLIAANTCT